MGVIKMRPMLFACASAVFVALVCAFLNSSAILAVFCALAFSGLLLIPLKFECKKTVALAVAASALMSLSFYLHYSLVYDKACRLNGEEFTAECTAISESRKTLSGSYTVDVRINITDGAKDLPSGCRARLYSDDEISIVPSAKFTADISVGDEQKNNKFDGDGIHITAYARNVNVTRGKNAASFSYFCYAVRKFASDKIMLSDSEASGFVKGMILGDKSDMSSVFANKFSDIGMAHVTAVSGMHLLFAVLFFDFIMLLFGAGYKIRCAVSYAAVLLFVLLSGFSVSCIRSGIMLVILYSGKLFKRFSDSLTSLSLAAFVILLVSPYNIGCASFLLSVSAVFGIVVLSPVLNLKRFFGFKNRFLDKLSDFVCKSLAVSLSANIACLPVFVIMFGRVNLLSPLSNLILILPVQLVFYLGFLGMLLFFVPFLPELIFCCIKPVYFFISAVTDFGYGLKYTSVTSGYDYFYAVFAVFAVLIIGIYIYNVKFPGKKIYPYVAGYAALCIVLFSANFISNRNCLRVDFTDVGQGSCTVFSKGERAVIIDCGGEYSDKLYQVLSDSPVKYIDAVALTHMDEDHIKYLEYLINSYEIDKIIYPEFGDESKISASLDLARLNGTEICAVSDDTAFKALDGAELQVFVERAYHVKRDRNASALYKMTYCKNSVVCPGDMNVYQEYVYTDYGQLLDCDILAAAHHGSRSSSYGGILELYTPDYTVISVGRGNAYGHPDAEALKRLSAVSEVLRTDELSTVTFKINKNGYKLVKK